MADWVEALKLAVRPRYSFSIWVTLLIILLIPELFELETIRTQFGPYLKIAALFFFVVWVVELVLLYSDSARAYYAKKQQERELYATIEGLSQAEKRVLKKHLDNGNAAVQWLPDLPEIVSLLHKRILQEIGTGKEFGMLYLVCPETWRYIQNNKDSLFRTLTAQTVPPSS